MSDMLSQRPVLSVSELNELARGTLEDVFPDVLVEGEVSNLARPPSGHLYFSLKDSKASVRCALFRNARLKLGFELTDGMKVQAAGKLSLYAPRGDYQLIASTLYAAGTGKLLQEYERLKKKLHAEGLFARSRELPTLPHTVGVITSTRGAAIRDVLSVLARRCPSINVIVYPTLVQGAEAATGIVKMLRIASQRAECDVLLLVRGGGSMEDLQAFNEEKVAREIAACPIPVVSGVGHEIDFSIADFAADCRAATPSAAAESVSPDCQQLQKRLLSYRQRMLARIKLIFEHKRRDMQALISRFKTPEIMLQTMRQRVDELSQRLSGNIAHKLAAGRTLLQQYNRQLRRPDIRARRELLDIIMQRAYASFCNKHRLRREKLASLNRTLQAVNPRNVLERGFAIAMLKGKAVESAEILQAGDKLRLVLHKGEADCTVDKTR